MGFIKTAFALTPIGAAYNLLRIAAEHENHGEIRRTAIGWNPYLNTNFTDYHEEIGPSGAHEYYRIIREAKPAREVKADIKVKLPRLIVQGES